MNLTRNSEKSIVMIIPLIKLIFIRSSFGNSFLSSGIEMVLLLISLVEFLII